MPVSVAMPDDVRLLHTALSSSAACVDVANCGTAMRFLTAYYASLPGREVVLQGCERMHHRPVGQLVDALRALGADITYLGAKGYPPLRIRGRALQGRVVLSQPQSSQFVSALLLVGIEVDTDCVSPYVDMTRWLIEAYARDEVRMEYDWSAAAFWYEYVALHGGELLLSGLQSDSLQGDGVLPDLFAPLGVETTFVETGAVLRRVPCALPETLTVDFSSTPDSYPALALTCERLEVVLHAEGTESLPLKESDRLAAVSAHEARGDHRMAMALLAADWPVEDVSCVAKSYPLFYEQLCQLKG